MKKTFLLIASVALALCACNKVDHPEGGEKEAPLVYHLNIQASMDPQTKGVTFGTDGKSVTTGFEDTDCIYVYNETKLAFARNATGDFTVLHPADISASGKSCKLSGDLSFFFWDESESEWESVSVEETDTYALYYQLNNPGTGSSTTPIFDYSYQDGGILSVSEFDFAEAAGVSMTLSGSTLTVADGVQFKNLQSMFRLRLSFTKGGVATIPGTLTSLEVSTKNGTLIDQYSPADVADLYGYDSISLAPPSLSAEKDIYLSLAFHYDTGRPADGDELILKATDVDGNTYLGSKAVPTGGFVASKYYYGAMTLAWTGQNIKPTVTRGDGGSEIAPDADGEYTYNYSKEPHPTVITITGNSVGYNFYFGPDATITLAGGGSAESVPDNRGGSFIYGEYGFRIILAGNYTLDCRSGETAIWADWGDLTLETNTGSAQTLTVIASIPDYRGLYGENYADSSVDPSKLAATGFTVVLTSTTDGPDSDSDGNPDYYTWVYTVTPTP